MATLATPPAAGMPATSQRAPVQPRTTPSLLRSPVRPVVDKIASSLAAIVAVLCLVGAGLGYWGFSFAHGQVQDQLTQQKIFFPPAGSAALQSADIGQYLNQYAGQQLTTGAQAEAYADHFINVHLQEIAGGQTYAQLSTKSQANPNDAQLAGQVQTMFRGETLRGLLLNAYAFDTVAFIILWASIALTVAGVILAVLAALGFRHARRVAATA